MSTLGRVTLEQPEDLEVGRQKLDPTANAVLTLQAKGLLPRGQPLSGYRGEMPRDITSLDDDGLGDLLNNLAAWCGFVAEELSKSDIERNAAKQQLEFIEARVRLAIKANDDSKKMTVQDKNDVVTTDPRVVDARSRSLYTEAIYTMTRTILNTAQRDWETVSRRITQRGQDIDRIRRETNVAGTTEHSRFRRPGQPTGPGPNQQGH